MLRASKKGQIFTLDIIVAIIIFTTILTMSLFGWNYTQQKIYENEVRNEMEFVARNAASALVLTRGNPIDWNNTPEDEFNITAPIYSLGLTTGYPGILSMQKIYRLENYSHYPEGYEAIKKFLGVNPYEIYVEFWDWDRNLKDYGCTCRYAVGALPPQNATEVARTNRIVATIDEAIVNASCTGRQVDQTMWTRVMVKVWKNETQG